ncbi:MAG TPA: VWA domain-containing protein, partial [Pseudonocardiaceae bacterium]
GHGGHGAGAGAGNSAEGGGGRGAALPPATAPPFDVLAPHHVEHVFATWYAGDRRSDMLLVVDVSGSMAAPAPGTATPLIDVVREGCAQLGALLPDDSELAVWEFGSALAPPFDHRVLLDRHELDPAHRAALGGVTAALAARRTGTGLYDTLLAAYLAARDGYRDGVPNHVLLFTDGRNEDDPGSITAEQLTAALTAAVDPARPVQLTVVTFGPEPDTDLLTSVLAPVDAYVDPLTTADEVRAVFIHVAAGGLHH